MQALSICGSLVAPLGEKTIPFFPVKCLNMLILAQNVNIQRFSTQQSWNFYAWRRGRILLIEGPQMYLSKFQYVFVQS